MISEGILAEFKERMRLGNDEDANLKRNLAASVKSLTLICGGYNIDEDVEFKELVFERSRYAYNDALEYFDKNFLTQINTLGIAKALEEIQVGDSDAEI